MFASIPVPPPGGWYPDTGGVILTNGHASLWFSASFMASIATVVVFAMFGLVQLLEARRRDKESV